MRTARQSLCKLRRYFCRRLSQISFREFDIQSTVYRDIFL